MGLMARIVGSEPTIRVDAEASLLVGEGANLRTRGTSAQPLRTTKQTTRLVLRNATVAPGHPGNRHTPPVSLLLNRAGRALLRRREPPFNHLGGPLVTSPLGSLGLQRNRDYSLVSKNIKPGYQP